MATLDASSLISSLIVSGAVLVGARIVANSIRHLKCTQEYDVVTVQRVTRAQLAQEEVIEFIGPNDQALKLKLPRTVNHGDRIRLAAEGFENKGDLYVLIKVVS